MLLEILSVLCLGSALIVLVILSIIDLKTFLLPNKLVALFALLGVGFHLSTSFLHTLPLDALFGALAGGGLLYAIRFVGNRIYDADTLGLGDVKLMAAGGLWLGVDFILIAITLGALAGFFHGIGLALYLKIVKQQTFSLNRLNIPAGPGFAFGTVVAAVIKFLGLIIL
jgi:leader peptidase (prepilin peptidase)/N-methyltransferase